MVTLYLIANCQTETLDVLAAGMISGAQIWSTDFLVPESHTETAQHTARARMEKADLIVAQAGGKGLFDAARIKQEFPNKTVVIAGLYFRGLHPDSCYLGAFEDRFQNPSLYHSVAVLDAFKQGRPEKGAASAFNIDNFRRLGLLDAWDSSLEEMRRRDRDVDVPAADFIDQYCREFPGFLSMNHPTLAFMQRYLSMAFHRMGLPYRPMDLSAAKDPMSMHDVIPVHDFVAEHYGLPYRTTQHWMIHHLGKKYIDRAEYVRRSYHAYRQAEEKRLTVHSPGDLVASLRNDPKLGHLV